MNNVGFLSEQRIPVGRFLVPPAARLGTDRLEKRIRAGLKKNEFKVVFQPIIHARNGALAGVECLVRWQHPDYGMLLPGSFQQAFANTNLAREISYFVLENVCQQLAMTDADVNLPSRVSINIQPSQLIDDDLCQKIETITTFYKIDPSLFELELVETEDLNKILALHEFTQPLRRLGVRLAIDDFGSGYSSLISLDRMKIDTIKLCREFMLGMPTSPTLVTIVRAMLSLFAKLEKSVVVEGVETLEQLQWLAQHGEVLAQGYYIAAPKASLNDVLRRFSSRA